MGLQWRRKTLLHRFHSWLCFALRAGMVAVMTARAIILGVLLGLTIAGFAYFNDTVIQQTRLVDHYLPLGVFGPMVLLLFVLNPLLRLVRAGAVRPVEVAVMGAVALAACGWPGSNFFRTFSTVLAMPSHLYQAKGSWQAAEVMSYVPGGSPLLAEGFVRSWEELARELVAQSEEEGSGLKIWESLSAETRRLLTARVSQEQALRPAERRQLLRELNQVIADGELGVETADEKDPRRQTRAAIAELFRSQIVPAPRGEGVLLAGGEPKPDAVGVLLTGDEEFGLRGIPWETWWPTLRLWGAVGLLVGLGSVLLVLVVHPQWSERELLAYPIARFVQEATQEGKRGWLPLPAESKLFWYGLAAMIFIHTANGLHAWFPGSPRIPLLFDFNALAQLFPNAAVVTIPMGLLWLTIIPTATAFAYFLDTRVSFTIGVAGWGFRIFGAFLLANGVALERETLIAPLIAGSYLGFLLMMLYVGRRYYLQVAGAALTGRRMAEIPAYSVWAARGWLACVAGGTFLLHIYGGLSPWLGLFLLLTVFLILLVITRINAETGMFVIFHGWFPVGLLTTLVGVQAIGPSSFIVLALGSLLLVGNPRDAIMPFIANGLRMVSGRREASASKLAPVLLGMVAASFFVALGVTLYFQYNYGVSRHDLFARERFPGLPFDWLTAHISDLSAYGELTAATASTGLERLGLIRLDGGALFWLGLGFILVVACAGARLRLPWWPIHPIFFLIWIQFPAHWFGFSFLLGWLIKVSVVKLAGAQVYHRVKPLMIGVIAGEFLAALGWIVVGAIYYLNTGIVPKTYNVFPV